MLDGCGRASGVGSVGIRDFRFRRQGTEELQKAVMELAGRAKRGMAG